MRAPRFRQAMDPSIGKRRLGFESLECRRVLSAGSVTTAVTAGVLTLTGDANDDAVQISGDISDAGTFKIQGLHGTQINGVANGSVTEVGVTDIATAGWGNGRNFFGFSDKNATGLAGGLSVTMGDGNDEVDLGSENNYRHEFGHGGTPTVIGGDVQVTLGNGNDKLEANNLTVSTTQGMLVTMGNGNDEVDASNVSVTATGVSAITGDQGFGIVLGGGNDRVEAHNVNVTATGTITGRQGFGISMGDGNDRFEASGVTVSLSGTVSGLQGFGVMMGNGNDHVTVYNASVSGGQGFAVSLGNGNDDVDLGGGEGFGEGKGHGAIEVTGSALVMLGTGGDDVDVDNMTVGGDFNIQKTTAGGSGAKIQLSHVTVDGTLNIDTSGDTASDKVILGNTDHWGRGWWKHAETNTIATANVLLGSGQNTLKVTNSTITTANFNGGTPGPNTYVQGKNVTITNLTKTNFT